MNDWYSVSEKYFLLNVASERTKVNFNSPVIVAVLISFYCLVKFAAQQDELK